LSWLLVHVHSMADSAFSRTSDTVLRLAQLLSLKLLPLMSMTLTFSMKTQLVPSVQFLALLSSNLGSFNAAIQFAQPINESLILRQLSVAVNRGVCGMLAGPTWLLQVASEDQFQPPPNSQCLQLLSVPQCLLLLWIGVQSAVFWAMFLHCHRQEMFYRSVFLQAMGLRHVQCRSCFANAALCMGLAHVCFSLFLVLCLDACC
jgi:hypothetical protein